MADGAGRMNPSTPEAWTRTSQATSTPMRMSAAGSVRMAHGLHQPLERLPIALRRGRPRGDQPPPLPSAQRLAHLGDVREVATGFRGCPALAAAAGRRSRRRVMRPGRALMTATRLERKTASGMEWVTKMTVIPVRSQMLQHLGVHAFAGHLVERAEGLVHEQQGRREGQGAGDGDALLHAARQLVRVVARRNRSAPPARASRGSLSRLGRLSYPNSSSGSRTLSSTVRQSKRIGDWKTIP